MNKLVKRALWTAALTGGLWAAGTGMASATETDGSQGLGSGSQAVVSIAAPVTVAGNAIGVLGDAETTESSAATTTTPTAPSADVSTSGIGGVLSGTQAVADVAVPITVGGNAIAVLGDATSDSSTASATTSGSPSSDATTSGDHGVLSGTQAVADVAVPITVGGNAIAVLGDAASDSSTVDSSATPGGSDGVVTSGDDGLLSGTQVVADVVAPITVGGNAIAVLGEATSEGSTATSETSGAADAVSTSGDDGLVSGSIVDLGIGAPITIGGNAIGVIGDAASTGSTTTPASAPPTVPTPPAVPTVPTVPAVPTVPTSPAVPTVPVDPERPAEPILTGGTGAPVLSGGDGVADGGVSRAALQRSGASAADPSSSAATAGQLPRTGLGQPEILMPALAMLALGLLLLVGARRVRSMR